MAFKPHQALPDTCHCSLLTSSRTPPHFSMQLGLERETKRYIVLNCGYVEVKIVILCHKDHSPFLMSEVSEMVK